MKTTIQLTIFINSLFLFFSCSDINEVTFNGENDRTDVIYSLNIDKINEAAKNELNAFDNFGQEHNLGLYKLMYKKFPVRSSTNLFEDAIAEYGLNEVECLEITETITEDAYNNDFKDTPLMENVSNSILKMEISSFLEYFRIGNEENSFNTIEDVNTAILLFENNAPSKFINPIDLQTYLEFTSTFRFSANYWYNYEIALPSTRAWKWWKFLIVAACDGIGAIGGLPTAVSASAAGITLVDKAF